MKTGQRRSQNSPRPPARRINAAVLPDGQSRTLHSLSQGIGNSPAVAAQRKALSGMFASAQRKGEKRKENIQMKGAEGKGGLPATLKSGIESLSGKSMDGVSVHYNSSKPAQLNALAYAQGNDIHLGPGQEEHLPHEAWHVVQQSEGRVRPTMQMQDRTPINDDAGLEREADLMGARALQMKKEEEKI